MTQHVAWWGWVLAGGLALWAAGSGTWRPVIVLALVAILSVDFLHAVTPTAAPKKG